MLSQIARVYNDAMNIIHYMHDKYYYEKAQMAFVDTNPRINIAYGVAGLSIALDSLSAIKYAKVTAHRNEIGLTDRFDIEGEFPCFGNNDDRVDHLGVDLVYFFSEELKKHPVYKNARPTLSLLTITSNVMYGKKTGATPDGRSAGEMIPANYSPSLFIDQRGPVSVIKSFTKPRLEDVVNGGPLTLEFDQSVFNNEESVRKLGMLVKTYIALGGHQLQLNTVSREKLLDAKVHPERHRNLIVRVWGWSGYFVELDECYQNHVINRIEFGL